jgi:hypothetical protein
MDYKNGKIYKIVDNGYTKMYIGSTTQPLSKRFYAHKVNYRIWKDDQYSKVTVYEIFDEFGIENCKIELMENYECNSKNELERKEGEYIKNNDCVNKNVAGRTHKEYYENNKTNILEKAKKIYLDNKINKLEYQKEYGERNKDKINKYGNEYYQVNREKILEKNKVNIICECGCEITKNMKSKHIKSKKHTKLMEAKI